MKLSSETEEALKGWVGVGTWHTRHHYDRQRFYRFVASYVQHHGFTVLEMDIEELIKRHMTEGLIEPEESKVIERYIQDMLAICKFLEFERGQYQI